MRRRQRPHRLGDPRRRRRDPARGRGQPGITCASGVSPSGPIHLGNLREFLTAHFVAEELRRRGVPVRHLHMLGRLRPLPQGAGRRRPVLGRAHRPPAVRRARPVGLPRLLGRALQGAAAGRARASSASRWRRSARPSGTAPAPTASRSSTPSATATRSRRCWPATAPRGRPRRRETEEEAADAGGLASPTRTRTRRAAAATWPASLQALLPRVRPRHDHRHVVRRRHHRPGLHLPACGFTGVTNLATQNEGKLVWKVDWPMRWAVEGVDFEPGRRRPHDARVVVHRRQGAGRGRLRLPRARVRRLLVRRRRRHAEDVVLGGRRADRGRRAEDPRGADPALALRPPPAQAGLQHRLRPRGRAAVRRVGRAGPQGRRPGEARRAGARLRAGLGHRGRRHAADPRRGRCRSGCCRRSPTSPPAAPS